MLIRRLSFLLTAFLLMVTSPSWAVDSTILQNALAKNLPAMAADALAKIPDAGPKLLAARSYYRSIVHLDSRWSWDEAKIAAFQDSAEQKALLAEIERVAQHFSQSNPGYTLYANTKVRSLDQQISSWNSNASVIAAGESLLAALANESSISMAADNIKLPEQLKNWLSAYAPKPSPNLAAPGLSAHGQMRAIDFQIEKNGALIAPADTAKVDSVWRAQGWDAKLKTSIIEAGPAFQGPLLSPDEPWHYTYTANNDEHFADETTP
jgi:hypothetical protein